MSWTILLYESSREEKPVEKFIISQQSQSQAKILHNLELLREYGPKLGMPHSKILGSGIYELRIKGKDEIRIFYCFIKQTIFLLHAFKKQTNKTPEKELKIATERIRSLLT